MEINRLALKTEQINTEKIKNIYFQFDAILENISKKKLSETVIKEINSQIETVNATQLNGAELQKYLKKMQTEMLKYLEREMKMVPKNYYRSVWIGVGMAAFGLPLGSVFGLLLDNIGFLGLGLPIGLAIGAALGSSMDKKAQTEGRQIDVEIKY